MSKHLTLIIMINIFIVSFLSPQAWAQSSASSDGLGCGGGLGPLAEFFCGTRTADETGTRLNLVVGGIVGFLTILGGLWFFIQFIIAGYNWISSGGDKGKVEAAQQKITSSLIGILIVVGAYVIVGLVGKMLGLDILNPGNIISTLSL